MRLGPWLVIRGFFVGAGMVVILSSLVTTGASSAPTIQMDQQMNKESIQSPSGGQANLEQSHISIMSSCGLSESFPPKVLNWCNLITNYAKEFQLDPDLVASVIWQESGGNPEAYSKSGAVGLMQVMPKDGIAATFMCVNGPCFHNRPTIEELSDPEFNVKYGTRMLSRLVNKYGNTRDALKAYGPKDVGYYYADKVLGIYQRHRG